MSAPSIQNKRAYFEYHVGDKIEAGMVLTGTEVKSIRLGKAQITDARVIIKDNEAFLLNSHVAEYSHGNLQNHDPLRLRKLLLKKREIVKLSQQIAEKGMTIIPLKMFFVKGKIKLEIALCKGKKLYDKRQDIKEKEDKRDVGRAIKEASR